MIQIFELRGHTDTEQLDFILLEIHKKYRGFMSIQKINVLDEKKMKEHSDVVEIIKLKGIEKLPLIKIDGKLASINQLKELLKF